MDVWTPNPYAQPYVPKYQHSRQTAPASNMFPMRNTIGCKRTIARFFKLGLTAVLAVTLLINVFFVLDTSRKLKDEEQVEAAVVQPAEPAENNPPPRNIKEVVDQPQSIHVEVMSSKARVYIKVDSTMVLDFGTSSGDTSRGIHVLVLNQATGAVMAQRQFDTYMAHEDEAMVLLLEMISDGRIVIFTLKDEGSFNLKERARDLLQSMGSQYATQLHWRDSWAMVLSKAGEKFTEGYSRSPDMSSWGDPVLIDTDITLKSIKESECQWPDNEDNRKRRAFCSKMEGYGSVCSCLDPAPITFKPQMLEFNRLYDVPVSVIASDRPGYLYRMLRSLLTAHGVNPNMITVFIDGYFEGPMEIVRLFGLRGIQHTPLGKLNARISQHYKATLTATFNLFPTAEYAVLIEEDLDIAPDLYSYFSQTLHLLDEDESLYCISAWNDQGYEHSSADPSLLYRVETMPGLGWMLKKTLFQNELEPQWPTPEKGWDWDMWTRSDPIRQNRECVIPDISRTFHFGARGLNMNVYFQEVYFQKHALNTLPNVKLKDVDTLHANKYEELMHSLVKGATVLDHNKSPCQEDFIPDTQGKTYVFYIKMDTPKDMTTWMEVAKIKCFKLWDLDARGFHKSAWRLFMKGNPIIVVGVPASPYSVHKPDEITPISMKPPPKPTDTKQVKS